MLFVKSYQLGYFVFSQKKIVVKIIINKYVNITKHNQNTEMNIHKYL